MTILLHSKGARCEPGKYFIGDLSLFLSREDWESVMRDLPTFVSRCEMGEGVFHDQRGREYLVESGYLGIWRIGPKETISNFAHGGLIVEFPEPFECSPCDDRGNIRVGDLVITTGEENECWEDHEHAFDPTDDDGEWIEDL